MDDIACHRQFVRRRLPTLRVALMALEPHVRFQPKNLAVRQAHRARAGGDTHACENRRARSHILINKSSRRTAVPTSVIHCRANLAVLLACLLSATCAGAADVVRYPLPNNSTFPIARAVEVPAGSTLVFHSGVVPAPKDASAPANSPAYWGDTKAQALSAFARIKESLDSMGLGFGDVVKMTVFLVADPASPDGRMDFKGFMDAYTQFYGSAGQPKLPARSAVQVANLASPGMLVEIEVILVRPAATK